MALHGMRRETGEFARRVPAGERATLETVRSALREGRVALARQPVVSAADPGRIAFHEGLMRLFDDRSGRMIPAAEFMVLAERTGAGRAIDCAALAIGLDALHEDPGLRLALNISARTIGHARWHAILSGGLDRDPTAGERLILEITEGSAMQSPERLAAFILDGQRRGLAFALDDFGAGQTAFRHLRDFCFDIVKIDRRFIGGVHRDPDCQVLVRALVMIARQFEMMVVAEGVESAQDADWLRGLGVDGLQGYLFGRPVVPAATGGMPARRRA